MIACGTHGTDDIVIRRLAQTMEAIKTIGSGVTDPHIRIFGETAYLYASHDYARTNVTFDMRDWQVWQSSDLYTWELKSVLRPEDTYIGRPFSGCWATDAVEKNGRYYWAFSEVDTESDVHRIGMVTGSTPVGPWRDELGVPLLADRVVDTGVYDPCFFTDVDGSVYILFGVWDYYIVKMAEDMSGTVGTPERIEIRNPEGPYGKGRTDDKVFLHMKGGIYYLSWGAYYATSSTLFGPYTYRGCIVDPAHMEPRFRDVTWPHGPTQGRHGSFFVWKDQWYFAYCEMCFSGNRYFRDFWISRVYYDSDGNIPPIIIDSTAGRVPDAATSTGQ